MTYVSTVVEGWPSVRVEAIGLIAFYTLSWINWSAMEKHGSWSRDVERMLPGFYLKGWQIYSGPGKGFSGFFWRRGCCVSNCPLYFISASVTDQKNYKSNTLFLINQKENTRSHGTKVMRGRFSGGGIWSDFCSCHRFLEWMWMWRFWCKKNIDSERKWCGRSICSMVLFEVEQIRRNCRKSALIHSSLRPISLN